MNAHFKALIVTSIVAVFSLVGIPQAFAAVNSVPIDKSFAKKGTAVLPAYKSIKGQASQSCSVTANGNVAIFGRFGAQQPGLPNAWNTRDKLATSVIGKHRHHRGWVGAAVERKANLAATDFGKRDQFVYTTVSRGAPGSSESIV